MAKSNCKSKWLDTCEVWDLGRKLEENNPGFCFLGVYASNIFDIVEQNKGIYSVCGPDPNLKERLNDKKCEKYGFVLNTDTYEDSGQHWISIYGERNNYSVLMDSATGSLITKEVKKSLKYFSEKINAPVKENCITNSQRTTLCGWYSIAHLQEKIKGKNCHDLFQLNDRIINYNRNFFEDVSHCNFKKPKKNYLLFNA